MSSALNASQLQWDLTKRTSSLAIRRQGIALSREANNLTGRFQFSNSLSTNKRAVGAAIRGGKVVLLKKIEAKANSPRNMFEEVLASKNATTDKRLAGAAIRKATASVDYRPDTVSSAVRKVAALKALQRVRAARK